MVIMSDCARAEISKQAKKILRYYAINDFMSEPDHQHQNPAERQIQEVKKITNRLLDCFGAPKSMWLLAALYACELLNIMALESLGWKNPLFVALGVIGDISAYLAFHWWEPVYFKDRGDPSFPNTKARLGRVMGISQNCGDILTFDILDLETMKVTPRSELRSAKTDISPNYRAMVNLESAGGEPTVASFSELALGEDPANLKLPAFSPHELCGMTFLKDTDDGQRIRAKVVKEIKTIEGQVESYKKKFLISLADGEIEEIVGYTELCDLIEQQLEEEKQRDPNKLWTYLQILDHKGPIKQKSEDYKGSMYNVLVLWDDGSKTWEPLDLMTKQDPVFLAEQRMVF
jgi:hypothetical protein